MEAGLPEKDITRILVEFFSTEVTHSNIELFNIIPTPPMLALDSFVTDDDVINVYLIRTNFRADLISRTLSARKNIIFARIYFRAPSIYIIFARINFACIDVVWSI